MYNLVAACFTECRSYSGLLVSLRHDHSARPRCVSVYAGISVKNCQRSDLTHLCPGCACDLTSTTQGVKKKKNYSRIGL